MPKAAQELYTVRFALGFDYVKEDGKTLRHVDRGQVIALVGVRNDEKLVRLGYITRLEGSPRLAECGVCGDMFIDEQTREEHGTKTHRRRSWDTDSIDAAGHGYVDTLGDGDEARVAAMSPLYMDKTAASQKA